MAQKGKGKCKELGNNGWFAAMAMLIGMDKFKPIEHHNLQFMAEKLKASTRAAARLWKASTTRHLEHALEMEDIKNKRENYGGQTICDPKRCKNP